MAVIPEISHKIGEIFADFDLDPKLGAITHSNQPNVDFQCNGVMRAAKAAGKKPIDLAQEIQTKCADLDIFTDVTVSGPGFLNFRLSDSYIAEKINEFSLNPIPETRKKIIIDYGGPNVAKPLHVGHLRSSIIGESIKRIAIAMGHDVIGDIHLGDWGTPMGMLIAELSERHPDWPYFSDDFKPTPETENPPFSVDALNSLYPEASIKCKKPEEGKSNEKFSEEFLAKARNATAKLQEGHLGYRALWKHFVSLSIGSIKEDLSLLDVNFDLWLGESDADPVIDQMVEDLLSRGIAKESDGAIIIDVSREDDKHDMPPVMLRKSDGAVTYHTTDLATIFQRSQKNPDEIIYVVDQRQSLHFTQVFRAAAIAGYMDEDQLEHAGFGTMNGKDGTPFKTRDGGVMKLQELIQMSRETAVEESGYDPETMAAELREMTDAIAVAAIKYGDLSNPRTSDYIFDPKSFVQFEGNTGPYLQYAFVRAKAVLEKTGTTDQEVSMEGFTGDFERQLALQILQYSEALQKAHDTRMPSELCRYMYGLARQFSSFYTNCHIDGQEDTAIKNTWIKLTMITSDVMKNSLDLVAIPAPERMVRASTLTEPRT